MTGKWGKARMAANGLVEKTCTPCRGGIPPLAQEEAARYLQQVPNWKLLEEGHKIQQTYHFKNFKEAFDFVKRISDLANDGLIYADGTRVWPETGAAQRVWWAA